MKRKTRLIHKWLGLLSCLFILLVSLTAVALNHPEMYSAFLPKESKKEFSADKIKVMAADPFNKSRIIASDIDKSLFYSADLGKTWTELKLFVPAEYVNNIVFDPMEKDRLIVSLKKAGIFVSDDGGEVWDELKLPFYPPEGEYIENVTLSQGQIIIRTRAGLYIYNSKTEQWQVQAAGQINKQVLDFNQLVYNIHTGRSFGDSGILIYDLLSLGLIILSISGIYLSLKPRTRVKGYNRNPKENENQLNKISELSKK